MSTELNEQVAVEIFGWKPPPNKLPGGETWEADQHWRAPDGTYHEHPPAYSTNWAAIGELWEWLVNPSNREFRSQDIMVSRLHCTGQIIDVIIDGNYGLSGRGTFPESLCRAALAAVRAREKEQDDGDDPE